MYLQNKELITLTFIVYLIITTGYNKCNAQQADQILINGKILTIDANFSIAEAIAISGERIMAVGSNDDILALKDETTIVTDLKGRTVIPGLIDNHVHYLRSSPYWKYEALFDGVSTRARAVELIKEKIAMSKSGEWVLTIGGWDSGQFTDSQANFSKAELDEIAPDNPVFIQQGFSGGFANSLAIDIVGSTTQGVNTSTGFISSAADGSYAGVPNVLRLALPSYNALTWKTEYLAKMNEDYNRAGITMVWNAGAIHYDNDFTQWTQDYVDDNNNWSGVRVFHHIKSDAVNPTSAEETIQQIANWEELEQGDYFRFQGFGEIPYMQTYDMMSTGWSPSTSSLDIYSSVLTAVAEKGWQSSEHAMVHDKFDDILPILENIDQSTDISPLRWTLHHCYGMDEQQMDRAKDLGLFLAMQNSPAMTGGAVADYYTSNSPAYRTAQASGIKWGLGSDAKIVSPYPAFFTLYFAVTGKDIAGNIVLTNETITREEALIAHTKSNAWYMFMEDEIGSLEVGKYADLVVLNKDYMTIPVDEIKEIESVYTMTGGRAGYDAKILTHNNPLTDLTFFAWSDQHIDSDGDIEKCISTVTEMPEIVGESFPSALGGEVKMPSFVFNGGDITLNGNQTALESYDSLLANYLPYPSYDIMGNHDQIGDLVKNWLIEKHHDLSYTFDYKGIRFITIYSEFDNGGGHEQELTQDALALMGEKLSEVPENMPVVLATHMSYQYVTNIEALKDVIGNTNIILWIGAHGHESGVEIMDGLNCIQLPSPTSKYNEFMVIRITPDRLTAIPWDYDLHEWSQDENEILDVELKDNTTAIDNVVQNDNNQSFKIFPNPCENETTIQFHSSGSKDVQILIYNIYGKLIKNINLNNYSSGLHQYNLNTANLSNGINIIQLKIGNNIKTQGLVKF